MNSLPEWTNDIFEGKQVFGEGSDFEFCANYDFKIRANTPLLARLSIGFLVREMLEHFEQKMNSTLQSDRSLWLYSAHDTTIANVLNGLGLFEVNLFGFGFERSRFCLNLFLNYYSYTIRPIHRAYISNYTK